mmetsp:Transcript_40056/g.95676  ORF Transcript_40056/g.95676 Transcript_40056/m.95676 type:complete len:202 (+) Transcript_40056:36-641(+)
MPRGLSTALRDWDAASPQEPLETHSGFDFPWPVPSSRRRDIAVEFLSSSQSSAGSLTPTSFKCTKQPDAPSGPKICWHYPGEDTSAAMLTPPEDSGVHCTDAVNKAWRMKVAKFMKVMTYFGGGLLVGGVATLLRHSVQEFCPPGSINWALLCNPAMWFPAEEEDKTAASAAAAAKGRPKFKPKAKPKARADDEESDSYSD